MGAFKKLNRKDVFVSDYVSRKQWGASGSLLTDYGIELIKGTSGSSVIGFDIPIVYSNRHERLVYESIKHLYYTGSLGFGHYTGSWDHSLQSTLSISGARELETEIAVFSISQNVFGTHIEPGTFTISSSLYQIIDDKEGSLTISGSGSVVVGDIIYNQGLAIITKDTYSQYFNTPADYALGWKSNQPIYTYNVYCTVRDSEMNFTYNRTALSGSSVSGSKGYLADNITGSSFTPYITTIGLYDGANELIAVAKLNKPIPKSQDSDMTFIVRLDV